MRGATAITQMGHDGVSRCNSLEVLGEVIPALVGLEAAVHNGGGDNKGKQLKGPLPL